MFNLNQAIAGWRRQMIAGGIKAHDVLEELESHLRDEIDRQIRSGATEERAYRAAVAAIGEATTLQAEFAKTSRANEGSLTFFRRFYFVSVALVLLINSWTLLAAELSLAEQLFGFSAVILITLYLARLPGLLASLPSDSHKRLAGAIKLASSFLWVWPIWALLEAGKFVRVEIGFVPNLALWCLFAAVALSVLANDLNERAGWRGDSGGPPGPFRPWTQPIPPTRPVPPEFTAPLSRTRVVDPVVQQSFEAACGEASRWGHDYIGTEHVLLGLLQMAKGPFADVLRKLNLDREAVRVEVERLVAPVPAHRAAGTIPFTPRARKAIQLAAREAKARHQSSIGAEHLFLGLLLEGSGVAAQVLKKLGLHRQRTREVILSEFGSHVSG